MGVQRKRVREWTRKRARKNKQGSSRTAQRVHLSLQPCNVFVALDEACDHLYGRSSDQLVGVAKPEGQHARAVVALENLPRVRFRRPDYLVETFAQYVHARARLHQLQQAR